MIAKQHLTHDRKLVLAVCDKEIVGVKFSEDEKVLDLSADFYSGEAVTDKKLEYLMRSAYIINIAGKKSLAFVKKLNLVDEDNIITIGGVPHAQILVVSDDGLLPPD